MSDVLTFKKEKNNEPSKKVEGFITKNRKFILSGIIVLIVLAIVLAVVTGLKNKAKNAFLASIDSIEFAYTNKSDDLTEDEVKARQDQALLELEPNQEGAGVGAVRALLLSASIVYDKGEYEKAASLYEKAALADEKAYTSGISWFNAASSYEQAGNKQKARELFQKASTSPLFVEQARAIFNYARLSEELSLLDEAKTSYQSLVDKYTDSTWANVAQARLIAIEASGK